MSVIKLAAGQTVDRSIMTKKAIGIMRLSNHNFPTPDAIYLDQEEYDFFLTHCKISETAERAIAQFVHSLEEQQLLPLVSIRCESKQAQNGPRTPYSLLNVGLKSFSISELEQYPYQYDNIEAFRRTLFKNYSERITYLHVSDKEITFSSVVDEILFWLKHMYVELQKVSRTKQGLVCGIIIQRMVFGCLNTNSGNGICCNLPGPITKETRFRGVFLSCQQGVGVSHGCWGENEMDLLSLKDINSRIYFELRGMFDYLEYLYGENCYCEFTVEGERLYLLDYAKRQRKVLAGE